MTFYDLHGRPIAYLCDDNIHIYLFDGKPVAYLHNSTVYGFNGHHLGWFEKGWIRDLQGYCVFFTKMASGSGPIKPIKQIKPIKSIRQIKPIKSIKQIKRIKPINKMSWSTLSGEQFFEQ